MFGFLSGLNIKIYIGIALVLITVSGLFYVSNLKSELETTKIERDEANKNNELIIKAYEQTLAIEREISEQKTITKEQKQEVIKTTSKVKEAVIKRGEIKQDEKSNFTIVTF